MKRYLVYRCTDGYAWRFPNGEVPGEIGGPGQAWQESCCTPRDFYVPGPDNSLTDVLESGFTVAIEEM